MNTAFIFYCFDLIFKHILIIIQMPQGMEKGDGSHGNTKIDM